MDTGLWVTISVGVNYRLPLLLQSATDPSRKKIFYFETFLLGVLFADRFEDPRR